MKVGSETQPESAFKQRGDLWLARVTRFLHLLSKGPFSLWGYGVKRGWKEEGRKGETDERNGERDRVEEKGVNGERR